MRNLRSIAMGLGFAILSTIIIFGVLSLSMLEGNLGGNTPAKTEPSPTVVLLPSQTPSFTAIPLPLELPTGTATLPPTPTDCPPPAGWIPVSLLPDENLTILSLRYNINIDQLIQANCLTSGSPAVGTILYVPPLASATRIPCGPPAGWIFYIVQPQDNLYQISRRYRTTVPRLQFANCLGSSTLIISGQRLYVPNVATITPDITASLGSPALTLEKTSSTASFSITGRVIDYTYNLKNTGNVTLSGPFTVSDNKTIVSCPATASLAPGGSINCNAIYSTTQNDLDAGSITNAASGHAFYGGAVVNSNQDSITIPAVQTSSLTLEKTSPTTSYVLAGDALDYNYNLRNTGNVTLAGPFTVSDDKTSVTCPATASLAPSASINCTSTYLATETDVANGFITNVATGHAMFMGDPIDSNQDDLTINATIPVGFLHKQLLLSV